MGGIHLFEVVFLFSLGKYPEVELLECMVVHFKKKLIFSGSSILFSHQRGKQVPFSPHLCQHLLYVAFLIKPFWHV